MTEPDLFHPAGSLLQDEPPEAYAPRPGMVGGDVSDEAIRAVTDRLVVWCGPHGWRHFGALLNGQTITVQLHKGRLRASLVFDLGAAKLLRGDDPEEQDA